MKNCMSKKVMSLVMIGTILSSNMVYAKELVKKDESVYVNLSGNGSVKEEIVSDWLHVDNNQGEIQDISDLNDIKNIKSSETPEISGEKLIWKTDKKDIFYQGKTEKKLPIEVKISYYLNDEEVNPKDIAGKSGALKIKINYINKAYKTVNIKGENKKIYTPFTVMSIVNLPMDKFTNVKSNLGQIVSDGNNQAITSVVFPGLKESLNVSKEVNDLIDLKETLEITAEVKKFEMGPIMITATPKLPEVKGFEKAKNFEELFKGLDQLKDASSKLEEGSLKLKDGSKKLMDGLNEANDKVNKATDMMGKDKEKISLINSDYNVAKERKLIEDAFFAKDLDTSMLDLASVFSDPKVQKLLQKSMKDYKALNINSIMQLPSVKKLMSDENLNNMNKLVDDTDKLSKIDMKKLSPALEVLNYSDKLLELSSKASKLYNGIDLSKIDPLIKLAENKDSIIKIMKDSKDLEESTKSNKLKALTDLMSNKDKMKGLISETQELSKIDTENMKRFIEDQNEGALRFIGATTFLSNSQSKKELIASISEDNNLTREEKGELLTLIEASSQVREAMKASGSIMSSLKGNLEKLDSMKNNLKVISPILISLPSSMDYVSETIMPKTNELFRELQAVSPNMSKVPESMDYVSKIMPEINKLNVDLNKNKPLLDKVQKSLTPETLAYVKEITPVLMSMKSDLDVNEDNLKAIKILLKTAKFNGGMKATVAKVSELQEDLDKAKPVIEKLQGNLTKADMNQMKNLPKLVQKVKEMQRDLKDSEKILEVVKSSLEQNNIEEARKLIDAIPSLSSGVQKLADGSKEIYNGMDKLSYNMGKFNKEGVEKLYTELKGKTKDVEKLLDIKNEIVKLSGDYETFTGVSKDQEGTVKFIMKTDEVKVKEVKVEKKEKAIEDEGGFVSWIKNLLHVN
ncbi:hypothetical protein ACER0A_009435 [Haloimpatiens sp. FM7315]|uniref:hypothetical protein n=1 Tax=Haloimpatiens sp. FM7315 TaxID=3298609 RepID=UPI00370CB8F2